MNPLIMLSVALLLVAAVTPSMGTSSSSTTLVCSGSEFVTYPVAGKRSSSSSSSSSSSVSYSSSSSSSSWTALWTTCQGSLSTVQCGTPNSLTKVVIFDQNNNVAFSQTVCSSCPAGTASAISTTYCQTNMATNPICLLQNPTLLAFAPSCIGKLQTWTCSPLATTTTPVTVPTTTTIKATTTTTTTTPTTPTIPPTTTVKATTTANTGGTSDT